MYNLYQLYVASSTTSILNTTFRSITAKLIKKHNLYPYQKETTIARPKRKRNSLAREAIK
jgi:hypothetical protein